MSIYAIRCFRSEERKFTHELTEEEAGNFLQAAEHLCAYLRKEYGLPAHAPSPAVKRLVEAAERSLRAASNGLLGHDVLTKEQRFETALRTIEGYLKFALAAVREEKGK